MSLSLSFATCRLQEMTEYSRNHYVPRWLQYRFIPPAQKENKFYYLDLKPETCISNKRKYTRRAVMRWGPPKCFCIHDLYTTAFGDWKSTEIEERFFGPLDEQGKSAVEYFASFEHPSADGEKLNALLRYMSTQKMRASKGLEELAKIIMSTDKNQTLLGIQKLRDMYCAIWTECVWGIIDASDSKLKFLLSDHPITVYNKGCFPGSKHCLGYNDPPIWLTGTHTIFPMSMDKALILTNLSWLRDPYGNPMKERPNPDLFRSTMFNFTDIQTGRKLSDLEVAEINFVIKKRAYRFIAAAREEWLYPERDIRNHRWNQLGNGYLFMPDPRSVTFSDQVMMGNDRGVAYMADEYGRQPQQRDFQDVTRRNHELDTHQRFKGEFARKYGSKRRGVAFNFGRIDDDEDDPDFHAYHLSLERRKSKRSRNDRRRK